MTVAAVCQSHACDKCPNAGDKPISDIKAAMPTTNVSVNTVNISRKRVLAIKRNTNGTK